MNETNETEAVEEFVKLCADSFKRDGGLRLSEPELSILLLGTAITLSARRPGVKWDGRDEIACYTWWDLSNALSRPARVAIHGTMVEMGVPFPPHPGDMIEHR